MRRARQGWQPRGRTCVPAHSQSPFERLPFGQQQLRAVRNVSLIYVKRECVVSIFLDCALQHYMSATNTGRYLHRRDLRREVHESLDVVESWNGANDFILYGRGGEIASNRLEDQEVTMLALHLPQNCMIYVNTLMVQRVIGKPAWLERMGITEQRALTPLFWGHVNRYGTFQLDMTTRLPLDLPTSATALNQSEA
jgi:hypothetical protein